MPGDTFVISGGGAEQAARALDVFDVTARLVTLADVMGPRLRDRIRAGAPRGSGPASGRLADSTRYQRQTTPGNVRMEFTSDVPYARYVTGGTRPHTIEPRAARVLHWVAPGGGDVFARVVHHPGTKPNPYPYEAYLGMRDEIITEFTRVFERFA